MINKRYIVGKKLGEGRSKVYNIIDTEFPEREVAAKFLSPSASIEEIENFRNEFFTIQKLDHPNIIKSFEFSKVLIKDEDEEIELFSPFITLEYFPSTELLDYKGLNGERNLNIILKQICAVLYYLHQSNYIYYDLKPENILIAEIKNQPYIKIIDLGFAQHFLNENKTAIKGTTYYIAPELLKNEKHNHTIDFYSFGILLYKIIYGKFPFSGENEIDIYKAHIEEEFEFGETSFSSRLVNVVSKLLRKNPGERYANALEILLDLNLPIDFDILKDFSPAKVFSDRKDALNILGSYLKDETSNEVFTVSGFDGAGKTSVLREIYYRNDSSILIENTKTKTGLDAIKYIFRKILLTEVVYSEKRAEYEQIIIDAFLKSSTGFIETIKKVFNTINPGIKLTVLLDDYNLYDDFTKEVLTEVIKIFQVKGIKIILSESSDFDHSSLLLNNVCEIQLSQFTDHQLSEFLELSYWPYFPKEELKKYILLYSDLLPGSIKQFIKDLILIKILRFDNANISFETSEEIILALQSSHEELYRIRLSNLNSVELKLVQIISAFEISVEQTVLAALLDLPQEILNSTLKELEKKNIIESLNISNAPRINSLNFKKFIYSTISVRAKFHLRLANSIKKLFPDFNTLELSRQYEIANEPEKAVEILSKEIEEAEEIHSYSYKRSLIEKSIRMTLPEKVVLRLTSELVKTLYQLGDYKSVLENVYKLTDSNFSEAYETELEFIKGSSLNELGKIKEGINILLKLKAKNVDRNYSRKIDIALASAEYDLNNFNQAEEYCKKLLDDGETSAEDLGKVNNLLALIEFNFRNNPQKSLEYSFEALKNYQKVNLPRRVAGMYVNIGAFYDIQGKKNEAEQHWKNALRINSDIGNLEQEGIILLNYGVFHQHNSNFENAIESWKQAIKIFNSIGMQNNFALALGNMGEVYLQICDYQNSFDYLSKASEIFAQLNNKEGELNVLFLQGKFWFIIGAIDQLKKVVDQYGYYFLSLENTLEKVRLNLDFLRLLVVILELRGIKDKKEAIALIERSKKEGENVLATDTIFLLAEDLIEQKKFSEAKELLNDIDLVNFIEENIIFTAQREFLLGKIAQSIPDDNVKSPIEYFENALNLLEGQSINELTWKVLYTIAETYWERGNFHKVKKTRLYAYELINMIGDNISNSKIRNAYFERVDRKQAIDKLNFMASQAQFNEYQKS